MTNFKQFHNILKQFQTTREKPAEPLKMGICGLLEGEPTTRFELVTYRLRIGKLVLIINDL